MKINLIFPVEKYSAPCIVPRDNEKVIKLEPRIESFEIVIFWFSASLDST